MHLHLTGNSRSGTTLLGNLLGQHPAIRSFPQPFPQLFIDIKKSFHKEVGHPERHMVLGNFYQNEFYDAAVLTAFLDGKRFDQNFVTESLSRSYGGQLTKGVLEAARAAAVSGRLSDIYRWLLDALDASGVDLLASKHIMCEEFAPHLVGGGVFCVNIVRDPRDVIVSAKYGRGGDYTGPVLPILFELRNWRKSAEFCLAMQDRSRFVWLRYEDLVTDPGSTLDALFDSLDAAGAVLNASGIDLEAYDWGGNSSFGAFSGVSPNSVGKYREFLDRETQMYISAICGREMSIMGYEPMEVVSPEDVIRNVKEPVTVRTTHIAQDYSSDEGRIAFEIERSMFRPPASTIFPTVEKGRPCTMHRGVN